MNLRPSYGITAALLLASGLLGPAPVAAQEDCVTSGNQHTRGADIEFSWARRSDDPQTKPERYQRALEKLQRSFEENPDEPRAYLLAGQAYLGLREWAGADSMFNRLLEMVPDCREQVHELRFNHWAQQYNLGITRWQQGDPDGALEAFRTANLILPDARSLVNAASLEQTAGNTQRAEELYRKALEVGGEPAMIRTASINLANLLRQMGREGEALGIYEEYSSGNPEDALGRLNYAIALVDAGRTDEATTIFQELLERDELTFFQWYEVGVGLYRTGDFARAATAFERAHALQPHNKEAAENLANSLFQAGKYEELIPLGEQLVDRYPYESVHYSLLANAHRELEQLDAALEVLQRRDGLPFEFLRAQLVAPEAEGGAYTVEGDALNRSAPPGSRVEVPFEFVGEKGEIVHSETLVLELPAEGESTSFQLQVQPDAVVAGFRYHVAGASAASGP